jgi:hypothetical protein
MDISKLLNNSYKESYIAVSTCSTKGLSIAIILGLNICLRSKKDYKYTVTRLFA